jgi:hypothetical protein
MHWDREVGEILNMGTVANHFFHIFAFLVVLPVVVLLVLHKLSTVGKHYRGIRDNFVVCKKIRHVSLLSRIRPLRTVTNFVRLLDSYVTVFFRILSRPVSPRCVGQLLDR